jgi:FO synthase
MPTGYRAEEAWRVGATEVHRGRHRPQAADQLLPGLGPGDQGQGSDLHVHAFSPMEIISAATKASVSVTEWLTELRDAGLDSIPVPRRKSSTTTCDGFLPRERCLRPPGSRW